MNFYAFKPEHRSCASNLLPNVDAFNQLKAAPPLDLTERYFQCVMTPYESAFEAASKCIANMSIPPDAVFAAGDTAAMAFIRAFSDMGLRIPQDVLVVGYNDIPSVSFFSPALTTIRQDTHKAGAMLVGKLMKIIEGKRVRSETLKTELIIRET